MTQITLRYFAAARAAAGGLDREVRTAPSPAEALDQAIAEHGPELGRVAGISSFLLNGTSLSREAAGQSVQEDATLDVLPPFAGG